MAAFTAASTHPGRLVTAFDIRPDFHDLPGEISLGTRLCDDSGKTWSPLRIMISANAGWGFGDASLIATREGEMLALFVASKGINFWDDASGEYNWKLWQGRSKDGINWDFTDLTAQLWDEHTGSLFFASGNGVEIRSGSFSGRLLQPVVLRKRGSTKTYASVVLSDDGGKTWYRSGDTSNGDFLGLEGGDESKILELPGGDLLLSSRLYPKRMWAVSRDGGESFSPAWFEVPDPGCNAGLALRGDEIILTSLYPPTLAGQPDEDPREQPASATPGAALLDPSAGKSSGRQDWSARRNLVWRRGKINGWDSEKLQLSWSPPQVIDPGPAAYSVALTLDSAIAVLWEREEESPYGSLAFTTLE